MRLANCLIALCLLSAAFPALADEPAEGELGGVPVVDRVKSVQRKPFVKDGRLSLSPAFEASVNDAFFQKLGAGIWASYHLEDALALRAHYARLATVRTDNVRIAKRDLHSRMFWADLQQLAGLDLAWTPVYGKLAMGGSKIVYFDLYLSLGFGAAFTDSVDGVHPAASLGGGARVFLAKWLSADLSFIDYVYREQFQSVGGAPLSDTQNVLVMGLGVSVFFPFSAKRDAP